MTNPATLPIGKNNQLPALSENAFLRYFSFVSLYIAQGIPEGMAYFGIPAWMAMNGKTPGEISGFVVAVGLPWSFKIVVAPLMDRFSYLPMGRRRPWVLFGQLGLIISFIALALVPDPLNNLSLFMAAGFAVGFFGAFQDVATDGMAIDIVPIHQQARANGLMWGAKIMGTSASLALGSWLLQKYGYTTAILMLSVAVSLIMLVPLSFRERPGEKLLPWNKGVASPETKKMQLTNWSTIFRSLYRVVKLRNSVFVSVMIFFALGSFNYMDTLIPIFTVQGLGWTDKAYSQFFSTASLTGGISGMIIGGYLIDRFGKKSMLNIYFLLLVTATTALAFLKMYWGQRWFVSSYMIIYQMLYVFMAIGVFSIGMQCCWKKVSASQFTLYMTVGNLGRIATAALIGPIKKLVAWEFAIFAFSVMIALAWIALQFVRINEQVEKVHALEMSDAAFQPAPVPA